MHSSIKDKGRPDAADGSLLNGMKANISEADVSLNAVHVAEGSAAGRPAPAQPVAAVKKQMAYPAVVVRNQMGSNRDNREES